MQKLTKYRIYDSFMKCFIFRTAEKPILGLKEVERTIQGYKRNILGQYKLEEQIKKNSNPRYKIINENNILIKII